MFRAWFARIGLASSRTADSGNAAVIPAVPSGTYPLVQFPEIGAQPPGEDAVQYAAPAATAADRGEHRPSADRRENMAPPPEGLPTAAAPW